MWGLKEILKREVRPALGCTEPVAVALACAHASSLLKKNKEIEEIRVLVSPGIYKNGMGVFIPGTHGERGLFMAAALGALAGDGRLEMEVLAKIRPQDIERARVLIAEKKVIVKSKKDLSGIYVHALVRSKRDVAEAIIEDFHTSLTHLFLNGNQIPLEVKRRSSPSPRKPQDLQKWLKNVSFETLYLLAKEAREDPEVIGLLKDSIEMNLRLSRYALERPTGSTVGCSFTEPQGNNTGHLALTIQKHTAAAVDARMAGAPLPAMSSAGSGNNGIVATIPLWAIWKNQTKDLPYEALLEATALSHLVTSKLKAHMGRVTPICSCSLCAGAGAAAGMCMLYNQEISVMERAVENHILTLFGILCDGAKPSCALKLANASVCALDSSNFAIRGIGVSPGEGLAGEDIYATLKNIEGFLSTTYSKVDHTLISIMERTAAHII